MTRIRRILAALAALAGALLAFAAGGDRRPGCNSYARFL
jgi:hypothetical protein